MTDAALLQLLAAVMAGFKNKHPGGAPCEKAASAARSAPVSAPSSGAKHTPSSAPRCASSRSSAARSSPAPPCARARSGFGPARKRHGPARHASHTPGACPSPSTPVQISPSQQPDRKRRVDGGARGARLRRRLDLRVRQLQARQAARRGRLGLRSGGKARNGPVAGRAAACGRQARAGPRRAPARVLHRARWALGQLGQLGGRRGAQRGNLARARQRRRRLQQRRQRQISARLHGPPGADGRGGRHDVGVRLAGQRADAVLAHELAAPQQRRRRRPALRERARRRRGRAAWLALALARLLWRGGRLLRAGAARAVSARLSPTPSCAVKKARMHALSARR